jgi:glycosyltransferase involved in cell wall biosynthesis
MKILIINSRFFLSAGPEKYMFGLIEILEKHGHEVIVFSTKNSKNQNSKYEKYFVDPIGGKDKVFYSEYKKDIKTIYQITERQYYSFHVKKKLKKLIKDTKPDLAYVLHHVNKLSPSVINACKELNLPVVMRLSDFSLVCPEGHLYQNNKICEKCIENSLFEAVRNKCVKNSLVGSIMKASALYLQRLLKIYKKVDYVVIQSKFTMNKVKHIFNGIKLAHILTFIKNEEVYNKKLGKYLLIVGRVEEHKGIIDAIKALKDSKYILKIVGRSSTSYDLTLKNFVKTNNIKNVEFLGAKYGENLKNLYQNARVVIIPTLWYENMPNVALEAMAYSRPIIASNLGSMKDIIKEGYNGLLFTSGDIKDFKKKIEKFMTDNKLCKKIGKNNYNDSIKKYNPDKHYDKLIRIFNKIKK